jgi:hypothetical protein
MDEANAKQIRSQLLDDIRKENQILIPGDTAYNISSIQPPKVLLPEFGIWSDAALMKKAEQEGYSVFLLPIINPFEIHEISTGMWPITKNKQALEISMTLHAFDAVHHTVFLIQLETQTVTLPTFDQGLGFGEPIPNNEQRWRSIPNATWKKHWTHIISRQAAAFAKSLGKQPWAGQILSVESQTVLINAGRDVGFQDGRILEVFEKIETQAGANPWKELTEGPKVGEIRITQTMDQTALAVPLDKAEIKPGQLVRLKN